MPGVSPHSSFLQRTRIGQPDSGVPTRWVARWKAVGKGLVHRTLFSLRLAALVYPAFFRVKKEFSRFGAIGSTASSRCRVGDIQLRSHSQPHLPDFTWSPRFAPVKTAHLRSNTVPF